MADKSFKDTPRKKHITFRTHNSVSDDLNQLAERVAVDKYRWRWPHVMRECTSRGAIIHHVLSGDITLAEIRQNLQVAEAEELNAG